MEHINLIFLRSSLNNENNHYLDIEKEHFINYLINNGFNIDELGTPVFYIETGGTEEQFKQIYNNYKEPYYFIATDHSNSLPASLEILTFLHNKNKIGKIIHGDNLTILSSLKTLNDIAKIAPFSHSLGVNNILMNKRYGVIGKPSDWLISSEVNYQEVQDIFGCKLIDIDDNEISKFISSYHILLNKKDDVSLLSNLILMALKDIVSKYKLDGLTIRCFDLLSKHRATSCFALAKLNEEGIIATCEGDIPSLLSMAVIKQINHSSSFQANPSYIDINNNELFLAHCTIPLNMVDSYKITTHFESGIGDAIKGELPLKDICIFKIHPNLKQFFFINGTIIENLHSNCLCRTQIRIKTTQEIASLLDYPYANHLIMYYPKSDINLVNELTKEKI